MSKNDRTVFKRPDGTWANKLDGADKASSVHKTQHEAAETARDMLLNRGGGELKIKGEDGKFRSKDTIGKPDPFPPRDQEH